MNKEKHKIKELEQENEILKLKQENAELRKQIV